MASLNRIQLIGRLGKEPEIFTTPKGTKVTRFSLAVDRRWRNANGEIQHEADWFNIEAWGNLAEICQNYLHKGRLVYLEGRLQTDRYEKNGETHYFTKVIIRNIQLLDRKPEEEPEEEVEEEILPDSGL
ncbi:MAG: single-stranded DNA-binding protein [Anaerolineales bacterium]|jgi:single-strand DNA-binding protein|nr:single-stranded DNA-binding protein [Anaerolineales bacterium]